MDVLVQNHETIQNKPQDSYKKYLCGMHYYFPCVDSYSNDVMLSGMSN